MHYHQLAQELDNNSQLMFSAVVLRYLLILSKNDLMTLKTKEERERERQSCVILVRNDLLSLSRFFFPSAHSFLLHEGQSSG